MKDTKKHDESRQLHKLEDYSLENKVELEDKEKVQSVSLFMKRKFKKM